MTRRSQVRILPPRLLNPVSRQIGFSALSSPNRRQPSSGTLIYFTPSEIEQAAQALADGKHRKYGRPRGPFGAEDAQHAEALRIVAYAGLRLGELLALNGAPGSALIGQRPDLHPTPVNAFMFTVLNIGAVGLTEPLKFSPPVQGS
jgi:hypothetical protein